MKLPPLPLCYAFLLAFPTSLGAYDDAVSEDATEAPAPEDDAVPEDVEAWKALRKKELEELGFTDRDLGVMLDEEVNILKEALLFPKERRAKERLRLTRERASKFISSSMKFSAYPKAYIEKLVDSWADWFVNTKEKRLAFLQEALDAMEAEELAARESKARSLLPQVLRDIDLHYKDVGVSPGGKARGQLEASWERLSKTTLRLSKEALTTEKTKIKRSGYDPVALKIIGEAIDSLFAP